MQVREVDVVIIGGGAAGLMCARVAGARGRRVVLVERNSEVGKKILISGGGRCNFTNLETPATSYHSTNPHFSKSALARYQPWDFIGLVQTHGIAYHEKTLGQLFCDHSARDIVGMLLDECASAGVVVETGCQVESVEAAQSGYVVETTTGTFRAESVVLAIGGLSIPKIGATDFGYQVAREFGVKVTELRPALVPLKLDPSVLPGYRELSGVSLDAVASNERVQFRENILFTHWGLSGPAILQISLYWEPGEAITLDLLPGMSAAELLLEAKGARPKVLAATVLKEHLPNRFVDVWCEAKLDEAGRPLADHKDGVLRTLGDELNGWSVVPTGTQGYKKAEVTRGGVSTEALSSKTLESKAHPGLYFIGEVVDVTGWLGGYNFQWAWASGHAAGQSV